MRVGFAGAAAPTTVVGSMTDVSPGVGGTFTLTSSTGWAFTTVPFVVVVDRGAPTEEKILCSAITGTTVTVAARGYDGTAAAAHDPVAPVLHVLDSITVDDLNAGRFTAASAGTVPITIKGAASQSANLQEWQDSAGVVLSRVGLGGDIGAPTIANAAFNGPQVSFSTSSVTLVNRNAVANIPLIIKGMVGQTGALQEWQNSASTVLMRLNPDGRLLIGTNVSAVGMVRIQTDVAARAGLVVQGVASQTADLFSANNDGGSARFKIAADGATGIGLGATATGAMLHLYTQNAAGIGILVRGVGSQTGNLQEWQDSASTILARVTATGGLVAQGFNGLNAGYDSYVGGGAAVAATTFTVNTGSAARLGLVVKGVAAQSNHLQQWQDSAGVVLASVNQVGEVAAASLRGASLVTPANTGPYIAMGTTGVSVYNRTTVSNSPLIVRGMAGQTGDLQQWRDSADVLLAKVDSAGNLSAGTSGQGLVLTQYLTYGSNSGPMFQLTGDTIRAINRNSAAYVPFQVRGMASQSGDLQQWQDSTGAVLAKVSAAGGLTVGATTMGGDLTLSNPGIGSDRRFIFSKTNDQAWLSVMETSSDQTVYTFGMGDNPSGQLDQFRWYMYDYQGIGGDWEPLKLHDFQVHLRGRQINVYGNQLVQGPYYTGGVTGGLNGYQTSGQPGQVYALETGTLVPTPTVTAFSGTTTVYWIKIDGVGTPDTFQWGTGPVGSNIVASLVPITGAAQTLNQGVTVTFNATTGGVLADTWQFTVQAGGRLAVGGALLGSTALSVYPQLPASYGIVVRAAASQTADLVSYQNSAGTPVGKVRSDGMILTPYVGNVADTGPYFQFSGTITANQRTTAGNPVFAVQGMASQTGDLQRWQDSAAVVLAKVSAAGAITGASGSKFSGVSITNVGSWEYITAEGYNFRLKTNGTTDYIDLNYGGGFVLSGNATVKSTVAATVGLIAKGATAQTADLQQWQDSAAKVMAKFGPSGVFVVQPSVTTIGAPVATSTAEFQTTADSRITLGEISAGASHPALTFYRTASGVNAGSAFRIALPGSINNLEVQVSTSQSATYGTETFVPRLKVGYGVTAQPSLSVHGMVSQTGDLQQWLNNAGTKLAQVDSGGGFYAQAGVFAEGTPAWLGARLSVKLAVPTEVGCLVIGAPAQTADLQSWQTSAGAIQAKIDAYGSLYLTGGLLSRYFWAYTGTGAYLDLSSGAVAIHNRDNVANVPLFIRGMAAQTGDLQQWQNSAGTVLARVFANGGMSVGTTGGQRLMVNDPAGLASTTVSVLPAATSWTGLVVQGLAAQSADLQQWQSSAGAVLSSYSATGALSLDIGGATGTKVGAFASTKPLAVTDRYVVSRGTNLVTNGSGLLGNNYNFASFTFDGVNAYWGAGGSFLVTADNVGIFNDELIPVDPSRTYEFVAYAQAELAGSQLYLGIAGYDVDGNLISDGHHTRTPGTDTTLAVALKPGDTTVTLTSSANWYNGAAAGSRYIKIWGYKNSFGYKYPDYTYTRHLVGNNAYPEGGITGNVITLTSPWAIANPDDAVNGWPIGTAISNSVSQGTYKYITAGNVTVPTTWTRYRGTVSGLDLSGTNVQDMFPPGTAYIKLLFLPNRTVANARQRFCNLSFAPVTTNTSWPAATTDAFGSRVGTDANDRFVINADGKLEWGPGNTALDANLYRSGASSLKTDGYFQTVGGIYTQSIEYSTTLSGPYIAMGANNVHVVNRDVVGNVPFIVKGMASQTGNLQQWQNSTGTVLAKVAADGNISVTYLSDLTNTGPYLYPTTTNVFVLNRNAVGNVPLIVKGMAAQSGDLQQWQDSAGIVLASVRSDGAIRTFQMSNVADTGPYFTFGTQVTLTNRNAVGNILFAIKGMAAQSGDLQQWQDSAGVVLTRISNLGSLFVPVVQNQSGTQLIITTGAGAYLYLRPDAAQVLYMGQDADAAEIRMRRRVILTRSDPAAIPLVVVGAASQTADLQRWESSASVVLAKVSAAGIITAASFVGPFSGTWAAIDDRTIAPSDIAVRSGQLNFTSWNNNNTSPYADALHLQTYGDGSGGAANLVMFRKDAIGMRIWQQTHGSATPYATYKDVALLTDAASFGALTTTGSFTFANALISSGSDATLDTSVERAFRSVRAGAWTDSALATFFQVGPVTPNAGGVAFTGSNGAVLPRILLSGKTVVSDIFYSTAPIPASVLHVQPNGAATVVAVMRGAASQTANLQEWQNSVGTVLGCVKASGYLGVATSDPRTKLQVNPKVSDDNSYTYDADSVYFVHSTPTSTTVLNDPKEVLLLARQGTGAQAYGAAASFNLSRYENNATNSRTRLDLGLAHGSFDRVTVMTLLSGGQVGIGTTSPSERLEIAGVGKGIRLFSDFAAESESATTLNTISFWKHVEAGPLETIRLYNKATYATHSYQASDLRLALTPVGGGGVVDRIVFTAVGNLQQWLDTNSTLATYIQADGSLRVGSNNCTAAFGSVAPVSTQTVTVRPGLAAHIPLVVTGNVSQTGDLQQWQDSSNAVLMKVLAAGGLTIQAGTTSDQLRISNNASQIYKIGRNNGDGLLDFQGTQADYAGFHFKDSAGATLARLTATTFPPAGDVGLNVLVPVVARNRRLTLSNFHPEYRWHWGQGTDLGWKKIADVTFPVGLYQGASFQVDILDANSNLGSTADVYPMRYYVSAVRSGGVQDDANNGTVAGPIADYVRLVKTATGVYEIQVRQVTNYRDMEVTCRMVSTQVGSTITYADTPVDGTTPGQAIYTASVTGYAQRLTNAYIYGNAIVNGATTLAGLTVGAITATGNAIFTGSITSTGANAGLVFNERDGVGAWQWWATGDIARLWNGSIDVFTVSSAGNVGIGTVPVTALLNVGSDVNNNLKVTSGGLTTLRQSATGGPILSITQVGGSYASNEGAITVNTDNPTGTANYLYKGKLNGTNVFSVRADGKVCTDTIQNQAETGPSIVLSSTLVGFAHPSSGVTGHVQVTSSDSHILRILSSLSAGSYNSIVQAGDLGLIYSNGTAGTGALVIAPWNGTAGGIRMDSAGNVTLTGTLLATGAATVGAGAAAFSLKPGSSDHVYLALYARTATPTTRNAYFGFGSTATTTLTLANEISAGVLNLVTTGGGAIQGNGSTFFRVSDLATNTVVLGTAAAAGSLSTLMRSDSTIAAFDATAPSTQAFGDAAVVGVINFAARRDHKHGMPAAPAAPVQLATFNTPGVLTVSPGTGRFRFPFNATILGVTAAVDTAPTGASLIVDVHKNGTTIFTNQANRPTIAISGFATTTEPTPDVTAMAVGDYLTVDVDQVGSTIAGADLTIFVRYTAP